jgi:UDP-N-acetylmuramoyl-tripeptide--D-alanyl-D-alanine ligase
VSSTTRPDGVTVIDDTCRADPASTREALKDLVILSRTGARRSWAVLGEMPGLGDVTGSEHDVIGRLAVRLDVSRLVSVGDPAGPVGRLHAGAILEGSWADEAVHVVDVDAAIELLLAQVVGPDVVLVKGAAGSGFERVVAALLAVAP